MTVSIFRFSFSYLFSHIAFAKGLARNAGGESLGCNDITPISKVARMLLMVESVTGVLYLAVLIARLVAVYSRSPETGPERRSVD